MSHRIPQNIPFGTTAASIKANRNLLYLAAKGVIPSLVPSARVAQEITNANLAKESRRQAAQFARSKWAAIQNEANEKWLRPQNQPVSAERNRRMSKPKSQLRTFLDGVEEFMYINAGRIR